MRNNIFSLNRFGLLLKQTIDHQYKVMTFSIIGFCGGLFILFLFMQITNGLRPLPESTIFKIFLFLFFGMGIIYSGTAFPGLRTKEKSSAFLLTPSSTFEKIFLEFIIRVALYILIMPIIIWLIYSIEGYFAELIFPEYSFNSTYIDPLYLFHPGTNDPFSLNSTALLSIVVLVFNVSFVGTTVFIRHPLIKTLFAVAIIFFSNLLLFYFFMEILRFKEYSMGHSPFFIDKKNIIGLYTIYSIILNVALLAVAYYKLKEKEV